MLDSGCGTSVAVLAGLLSGVDDGSNGLLVTGRAVGLSGDLLNESVVVISGFEADTRGSGDFDAGLDVTRLDVAELDVAELILNVLFGVFELVVSATFEVIELLVETIIVVGWTDADAFDVAKNDSRVIVCGQTGMT